MALPLSPYPVVSWYSRTQMSRFCLHIEMTFDTSLAPTLLSSTTRRVLAPSFLMSANDWFWFLCQAYGWLTPRMTKLFPLASTMFLPLTWRPTTLCADRAACAACADRAACAACADRAACAAAN